MGQHCEEHYFFNSKFLLLQIEYKVATNDHGSIANPFLFVHSGF